MSTFKMIEKLGLKIWDYKEPHHHFAVDAEELERLLQSAQVVYGTKYKNTPDESEWATHQLSQDTHSALLIGITPIKKKTKAEAALELLQEMSKIQGYENWYTSAAKRILEMKDDE